MGSDKIIDKIISLDTLGSGISVIPEEATTFYKQTG